VGRSPRTAADALVGPELEVTICDLQFLNFLRFSRNMKSAGNHQCGAADRRYITGWLRFLGGVELFTTPADSCSSGEAKPMRASEVP
jgi:hypothetical protein